MRRAASCSPTGERRAWRGSLALSQNNLEFINGPTNFPPLGHPSPQNLLEVESKSMSAQRFLKARARSSRVMNCPISKDTIPKIGIKPQSGQTGRMRLPAVQSPTVDGRKEPICRNWKLCRQSCHGGERGLLLLVVTDLFIIFS